MHYGDHDNQLCRRCIAKASKNGKCYRCKSLPRKIGKGVNKIEGSVLHIYYACENCYDSVKKSHESPTVKCSVCPLKTPKPLKMMLYENSGMKPYCSVECAKIDRNNHLPVKTNVVTSTGN